MENNLEEEADVGELNDIVGFHIRLAHGAVYRHFTETFSDLELTQKQVSVLWLVDDHPGLSQTDIGSRLQMDRATTMTLINRLQSRGFLRRKKSRSDGRKHALHLTPEGEVALSRAKICIQEHETWLKSRYTDKELKVLLELLDRLHD